MNEIALNIESVRARIEAAVGAASRESQRAPPTLIAVSKRAPVAAIRAAYAAGHRDFGENLAPEMTAKMDETSDLEGVRWHFLGRIQTNKAKAIVRADMVHGVGSARHAIALDAAAMASVKTSLPFFLQINIGDEAQKNGISPAEALDVAREVLSLNHLKLNGFMCVPPVGEGRAAFAKMQSLAQDVEREIERPIALSMGMSADFEDAIACGASHVRVGTAIFGARAVTP